MRVDIGIVQYSSISPLGVSPSEVWENYLRPVHFLKRDSADQWVGAIQSDSEYLIDELTQAHKYKNLDRSVLQALACARQLKSIPGLEQGGINLGSSRGATAYFEKSHAQFLMEGNTPVQSSPSTTLGNLSSWVAQELKLKGMSFSHSITCSTGFHAIANAAAWLKSGFSDHFIAGASEAPLTPFTLAQMRAMKIYSQEKDHWPSKSGMLSKVSNTLVLGEASSLFHLSVNAQTAYRISSIGYANEDIEHGSSISLDGKAMYQAMKMALESSHGEPDVIVMHAPGTLKGDAAEYRAIDALFTKRPLLTANKWKIGHSFGASGLLSLEFALLMLEHQCFINFPWEDSFVQEKSLKQILVNTVGFGGNAVSILIEKAF